MDDSTQALDAPVDIAALTDKAELLALVREVHVPTVSAWPALGWWLLAIVLLGILAAVALYKHYQKRYQRDAWRREALAELLVLKERLADATEVERHELVQSISSLLRRVMMQSKGRRQVAGLTSNAWLDEIESLDSKHKLDNVLQPLLTDVPYQMKPDALSTPDNVNALVNWLEQTIKGLPQSERSSAQNTLAEHTLAEPISAKQTLAGQTSVKQSLGVSP